MLFVTDIHLIPFIIDIPFILDVLFVTNIPDILNILDIPFVPDVHFVTDVLFVTNVHFTLFLRSLQITAAKRSCPGNSMHVILSYCMVPITSNHA